MGNYRVTRNLEASIIQYIQDELITAGLNNVNVEKSFARAYEIDLPIICVRIGDTDHTQVEIGSNSTFRTPSLLIDVFATSDGNRLDLKDFLVDVLKHGIPYYEYTVTNGQISNKIQNGRIKVLSIGDTIVNLNIDKNSLDVHDRFRHLLSIDIELGKVEN